MTTLRTVQSAVRLFNGVTLTSSFSGNVATVQSVAGSDEIVFYGTFTPGTSGDDVDIQLEFSHDGTNWYTEQMTTTAGGTTTIQDHFYRRDGATAATAYDFRFTVPTADINVRVSAKYNGTGTGTLTLYLLTSGL